MSLYGASAAGCTVAERSTRKVRSSRSQQAPLSRAERGELGCRVELVACVEEEASSSRGASHRATLPAPDACIVGEPSGWSGVTVGYKGFLRARLARTEELAHTAADAPGAAALACRQWVRIESEAERFGGGSERLFEQLLTHLAGVRVEGDGLTERRRARRAPAPATRPGTGRRASLARGSARPAGRSRPKGACPRGPGRARLPSRARFGRAIAGTGGRARYLHKTGTADLNVVAPAWGCPCVAYGPGDSALDHTPDEHIEVEELDRSIEVLARVLRPDVLPALLTGASGPAVEVSA